MKLWEIFKQVFISLQEDPENPAFWTVEELSMYAYEGLREIIRETGLQIETKILPLFQAPTGELGLYVIPVRLIQEIKNVYWVGSAYYRDGVPYKEREPKQLLLINRNDVVRRFGADFRNAEGDPSYAFLDSGDYDRFDVANFFNRSYPKLRLYPKPNQAPTQELQDYLESLTTQYIQQTTYGVLAGYNPNVLETLVYGLDVDGDGIRDDLPSGTTTGGIYGFDVTLPKLNPNGVYENYVFIEYVPDLPKSIFFKNGIYRELDEYIPYDLQIALREYITYRAFRKEGEAIDLQKSEMYYSFYKENLNKAIDSNYEVHKQKLRADRNFFIENNFSRW